MHRRFVHIVADYGYGDPAFGEVSQRLRSYYSNVDLHLTSVTPLDTLSTGFWLYQYGMGQGPEGMVIYSNTAPRKDKKSSRALNEGEKFMYAKLENGVEILAINAGYNFSFIKPHIEELRLVNTENKGSQFRSRDFYPKAVAAHLAGEDVLGDEVDTSMIAEVPESRVAWIDGYGNIKTTIRKSNTDYKEGIKVKATINGVGRTALVAGGNFQVAEGELSFSPGSSGYNDPFYELFLRGGSAEHLFDEPRTGAKVKIELSS